MPALRALAACLFASAGLVSAAAQEDVSALLEPIREEAQLPALGGAVVTREGVQALGVTGVRALDGDEAPVSADDAWHLGSLTKAMTAVLAARLAERGALDFDLTIGEALGEAHPDMEYGWRGVTLRALLTHRAGVDDAAMTGSAAWREALGDRGETAYRRAFVQALLASEPASAPGEAFAYSNGGYIIAGAMMQAVTGERWEALMRTELFEPLGMDSAGFGPPEGLRGHTMLGAPAPPDQADNPAALGPAGTVHASLEDYAAFARMMLDALAGESGFLTQDSARYLLTPDAGADYALGWGVAERDWAGGTVYSHGGSNTAWFAVIWLAPEQGFAAIAATNTGAMAGPQAVDQAVSALIGAHLDQDDAAGPSSRN